MERGLFAAYKAILFYAKSSGVGGSTLAEVPFRIRSGCKVSLTCGAPRQVAS